MCACMRGDCGIAAEGMGMGAGWEDVELAAG